jgi:hypothetical protein
LPFTQVKEKSYNPALQPGESSMQRLTPFLASLLLVVSHHAAEAFDKDKFLDVFKSQMQRSGYTMDIRAFDGTAQSSTISGFRLQLGESVIEAENLRLEGISDHGDGSFTVARIITGPASFQSGTPAGETMRFEAQNAVFTNTLVTAQAAPQYLFRAGAPVTAEYTAIAGARNGAPIATIASVVSRVGLLPDSDTVVFNASVPSIAADMQALPESSRIFLASLGISAIDVSATVEGTWDQASGKMVLANYRVSLKDAGSLVTKFAVEGLTAEKLGQFMALVQRMQNLGVANGEAKRATGEEMKRIMAEVRFVSVSHGFENAGIAEKLIAIQSAAMGVSPQELAAAAPSMLDEPLKAAGDPALAAQIKEAVSAFAANPGRIEVSANPAEPAPIASIMEAALLSPQAVIALLGLKVTAYPK